MPKPRKLIVDSLRITAPRETVNTTMMGGHTWGRTWRRRILVYVLLEHQSTPDPWLRLLGYCVQVWQQWHRTHEDDERLPLLVPVVVS